METAHDVEPAMLKRTTLFCMLIGCLLAVLPMAYAQDQLPDLIPEAVDLFSGKVRVMNAGGAAAGASKLVLICSKKGQAGGCPTSSTLESMYDMNRGGYVIDVPPLPARKARTVAFPMWLLQWERGQYTFTLNADVSNEIHESSESNNLMRSSLRWGDSGTLRITALSNGKPVPVAYQIIASGKQTRALGAISKPSGENIQTPVDISLVPGTYKLTLQAENAHAAAQQIDIKIESGKVVEQKVTFQQPGLLKVGVLSDQNEDLSRIAYSIYTSGEPYKGVAGGNGVPPYKVSLLPGNYDLHVYRKLSWYIGPKKPTTDIKLVMGFDEEQVIRGIKIQSGQTVEEKIPFKHIETGILNLHVLCDGKPCKSYVNFSSTQKNSPILFSFDMPARLKLVTGRYKLNVHPADASGSTFQNSGYGSKSVEIVIHEGEMLEKQVTFTKAKKGTLSLTALVDGSRSKAEIGIRRAGTKGQFGTLQASYNLLSNKADLLPGDYDFSIWPLEHHISPGGIDVFHGGVSGPDIYYGRIKGVGPVILHDVQINANETLEKTVKFEKH